MKRIFHSLLLHSNPWGYSCHPLNNSSMEADIQISHIAVPNLVELQSQAMPLENKSTENVMWMSSLSIKQAFIVGSYVMCCLTYTIRKVESDTLFDLLVAMGPQRASFLNVQNFCMSSKWRPDGQRLRYGNPSTHWKLVEKNNAWVNRFRWGNNTRIPDRSVCMWQDQQSYRCRRSLDTHILLFLFHPLIVLCMRE